MTQYMSLHRRLRRVSFGRICKLADETFCLVQSSSLASNIGLDAEESVQPLMKVPRVFGHKGPKHSTYLGCRLESIRARKLGRLDGGRTNKTGTSGHGLEGGSGSPAPLSWSVVLLR